MTKHYKHASRLCTLLSVILTVGPLLYFIVASFIQSDLAHEKLCLSMTILVTLFLTGIGLINKVAYKSKLWIVLIGVYLCLDSIMLPLILIASGQIVDELILSPLKKHYKQLYVINKEIDKRG